MYGSHIEYIVNISNLSNSYASTVNVNSYFQNTFILNILFTVPYCLISDYRTLNFNAQYYYNTTLIINGYQHSRL